MGEVYLSIYGDGTAWTDATSPMYDNEPFTVYFQPFDGAELLDVRAFDSHDYSIALPAVVDNELHMTFAEPWGSIYFDIYFSGSVPPEPPTPTTSKLWLLMGLKKNNERGLKPYVRN